MSAKSLLLFSFIACLTACTSAWINDPSPTTVSLVNDLKLEGFGCTAGLSSIECRQIEPYIERAPKVCSSADGCVKQPCHDVRLVYEIRQTPGGIPTIAQSTEKTVTKKISESPVYSGTRLEQLKEYCAL